MTRHVFAIGLALASIASLPAAGLAEKHRFASFKGSSPPELIAQIDHWINTEAGFRLQEHCGAPVWLQFNF